MEAAERAEREQRLKTVADEIDALLRKIAPGVIRLGHLRKELAQIMQELEKDA